jgi:hypothetical protein
MSTCGGVEMAVYDHQNCGTRVISSELIMSSDQVIELLSCLSNCIIVRPYIGGWNQIQNGVVVSRQILYAQRNERSH